MRMIREDEMGIITRNLAQQRRRYLNRHTKEFAFMYTQEHLKNIHGIPLSKPIPYDIASTGSYNKVQTYVQTFEKYEKKNTINGGIIKVKFRRKIRFAVRTSLIPSFLIDDNSSLHLNPELNQNLYDFMELKLGDENNWENANKYGLCPEMYFNGYIQDEKNPNAITLCTISKAYKMDVDLFFGKIINGGWVLTSAEENSFVNQLTWLLQVMARKMKMICFDIKPRNTVIDFDIKTSKNYWNEDSPTPYNLDVKLIDWDADFCRQYSFLKSQDGVISDVTQKASAMIMTMVFANFLFDRYQYNILDKYMRIFFENDRRNQYLISKVMLNLFEAGHLDNKDITEFSSTAEHYFQIGPSRADTDRRQYHQSIFVTMLKRSMCHNEHSCNRFNLPSDFMVALNKYTTRSTELPKFLNGEESSDESDTESEDEFESVSSSANYLSQNY